MPKRFRFQDLGKESASLQSSDVFYLIMLLSILNAFHLIQIE